MHWALPIDRRESLLAELKRVAADIGEIPSTTQIDEHSRYSPECMPTSLGR